MHVAVAAAGWLLAVFVDPLHLAITPLAVCFLPGMSAGGWVVVWAASGMGGEACTTTCTPNSTHKGATWMM